MDRRALLRATAAAAALALLPGQAEAAWTRALARVAGDRAPLAPARRATVEAIADALLPRTDTPGALDVGVPDWIEVIVAEQLDAAPREAFLSQLDAIAAFAIERGGAPLPQLRGEALARVMDALDTPADRTAPAARGYARLKGLVIHGYFTSRVVQQDVMHAQVIPGRFEGAAPHVPCAGASR